MMRRPLLLLGAVLLLGSCAETLFAPFPQCEVDCPLPPTVGPTVNWVHPTDGGIVRRADILHATATDDIGIASLEFYWLGLKVHAGVVAEAPYTVPFDGHPGINLFNYQDGDPIPLMVVATDFEGNADTSEITAVFDRVP